MAAPGMTYSHTDLHHIVEAVASLSPDPYAQAGALILLRGSIVALDCNRPPTAAYVADEMLLQRPNKAAWVEHAERNCIYSAARNGVAIDGAILVTSWFPCADCARAIVAAGIAEVLCVEPDWDHPDYAFREAREMLDRSNIRVQYRS